METKTIRLRGVYIFMVLLAIGIAASIVLAVLSFRNSRNMLSLMEANFTAPEQETQEDDVQIDSYTIRSTQNISDAYLTGDTSALDDKDRETLEMASDILDEIIQDGMTPYEEEKAVYDWMTKNLKQDEGLLTVIPSTQADCDNPYGTLKYHNAVCVGYATTFRLFMQMLDIPCMVVHNTECYHSWDLVQLDGEWYHTDIYSDVGTSGYFHFNATDAMISSRGLSWDTDFFPAANSVKYNVAYQNSVPGVDPFEIPAKVRAAINEKTPLLSFRYGKDFTEAQAQVVSAMMDQIQQILWSSIEYDIFDLSYFFQAIDDGYLFVINIDITDDSSEDDADISDEDWERIDSAVSDSFGDIQGSDYTYDPDIGVDNIIDIEDIAKETRPI